MKTTFRYASEFYSDNLNYSNYGEKVRIKKIIKLVGKNKKVLDVGCYNGFIGEKIMRNNNTVYGIDASKIATKGAMSHGINVSISDLNGNLPFRNKTFDIVIAGEIIEHIVDTDFFIDEIKRILKNNGELIITTPNIASLGRRIMLLFGQNPYFEASLGFPPEARAGHLRYYTKKLLMDFLDHKGFKIKNYESDVVNLPYGICCKKLADIWPKIGRTLIIKAVKKEI